MPPWAWFLLLQLFKSQKRWIRVSSVWGTWGCFSLFPCFLFLCWFFEICYSPYVCSLFFQFSHILSGIAGTPFSKQAKIYSCHYQTQMDPRRLEDTWFTWTALLLFKRFNIPFENFCHFDKSEYVATAWVGFNHLNTTHCDRPFCEPIPNASLPRTMPVQSPMGTSSVL